MAPQDEIDEAFVRDDSVGNMLEYGDMQSLRYMDMVIKETLRKYPPTAVIPRTCTKVSFIIYHINQDTFLVS